MLKYTAQIIIITDMHMSGINHKEKQGQYNSKLCNTEVDLKCVDCIYWCQ